MKYRALATDYDGTIGCDGVVDARTVSALLRARSAGLRLLLVTGRELPSLFNTFDRSDLFDFIVAENGAVLYKPDGGAVRTLGLPPPPAFVSELQRLEVPLSIGHSIVATVTPHEHAVIDAVRRLAPDWHVIFNKEAVMVLPGDVTKATGLTVALEELGITPEETIAVGDAENDIAFLRTCGVGAAVNNALQQVKDVADVLLSHDRGSGVNELIEKLLSGEIETLNFAPSKR